MKKFVLFVLLTVLLCVFAASAMADYGVQLWEDGPYFATSPFQDPNPLFNEPLRLFTVVRNETTGEAEVTDMYGNTYPTEHGTWRTADSDGLGIDPDWHIPTQQDMQELIANTTLSMDAGKFCFTSKTDSNLKLVLPATGGYEYPSPQFSGYANDGFYATTGEFLHLIPPDGVTATPSHEFIYQEWYAGEVILVSYPAPHTHGTGTDTITFTKPVKTFSDLQNLFTNGGSGYLAADITATGSLTVVKDVTLCLNDKVLNLDKKGNITVNSGVTFDLYDCGTNGKITGGSAENGGAVNCMGTFNMNGGTISGNTASNDGGAVYVDEAASFNMINGTITGNSATKYGGGVYTSDGGIILEGGTISNNSALYGGGVVNNGGTFVMKNGTISGNSATEGGGVMALFNTSCMKGGTISGNSASGTGGGVYISSMASFEMTAGQICNNDAPSAGGILCRSTAVMKLVAANDKTIEITGNKATKYEGGIANWGEMHLSGKIVIKNNTCDASGRPVNLATSNAISIDGALTGSEICITHADKDKDFNNTGILTSGFTTANPGAKLGDFFTYDGPDDFAMILNSSNELEVANVYAVTNGTKSDDKDTNHGYLTVSKTLAAASETVTVTVTPDTGYQLNKLTVVPTAGGDPITTTQDASDETKYTFTMPACEVTVTAEFIQSATDISEATTEAVNAPVYNGGEAIAADDFEITVTLLDGTVLSRDAYTLSFYPDVNCTSGTEVAVITDAGVYYALATGVLSEGYTGTTDMPLRLKVLKAALPKPVAVSTPIIFNGTEQTGVQLPDGADSSRYIISGDKATEIGAYMANAALADPDNYCWSGEDGDPETADYSKPFTIDWEIRPGAKATYIVKFMVDGTVYDTQEVEEGDFAKKPADPQKAGSTFNGWFESETASGSAFDFEKTAIMADQTLYAGWTKDSAVLNGIKISKVPDKTTYIEGETFDKTGMVITAIYSDGSTKPVDGIAFNPSGALTTADTAIEISYTENGITKTAKQTIQVNAKSDPTPAPTPTSTPTPAPTPAPYKVIEGASQTVMQDADSAKFRSDADYSKFLYVEVDGKKLDKNDYDSYSGSTVIVLKASFIKKLAVGVHTLKIVSSDGSAATKFTIKALPPTGDTTPVALLSLLLVGAICLAVLTIRKRKA